VRFLAGAYDGIARRFSHHRLASDQDVDRRQPRHGEAFAAVMRRAAQWANANPAASVPILARYTKLAPEVIAGMHRTVFALTLDPATIQPVIRRFGTLQHAAARVPRRRADLPGLRIGAPSALTNPRWAMIAATPARHDLVERLERELNALAIAQFSSAEFDVFFGTPLTLERARFVAIQMVFYNHNRREGWAYVQAKAPWDVKRAIWQHEQDELFNDPRSGTDHRALMSNQALALGVKPEDLAVAEATPLVEAVLSGFNYVNATEPWLSALTGSHFLERRNNSDIIPGGAMSKRWRDKIVRELGVPRRS